MAGKMFSLRILIQVHLTPHLVFLSCGSRLLSGLKTGWTFDFPLRVVEPWASHSISLRLKLLTSKLLFIRALPSGSVERIHLQCRSFRRYGFDPWVGKIPWRRAWQPTVVFYQSHFNSSVQLSLSVISDSLRPHGLQPFNKLPLI